MAEISAEGDAPDLLPPANEEDARTSASEARKPPLISLAMLKSAIDKKGISSLDVNGLSRAAYEGVLLKDEKQGQASSTKDGKQGKPYTRKYWVHKELNKNCWMVLAKALSISWGDDSRYWQWPEEEEPCYPDKEEVHVAELIKVCCLEIKGEFNTIRLSPWTTYEVKILVKMRPKSSGWEHPVNLNLALPDGTKQGRTENLGILEKEKWFPISIGKFETTPKTIGKMSFSLAQTDGNRKKGLCVKAIRLMPTTGENEPPR
ncbi:uncharacterized protein PHLOEM PROTEIN 2-LIKE A4-like isoform X2 [Rhodamnia argentea]|nr:uncharacterized protein PHLOEM PROTEIN 2-LIKE A4-like isoform X2 [Rhodamnia argentea]